MHARVCVTVRDHLSHEENRRSDSGARRHDGDSSHHSPRQDESGREAYGVRRSTAYGVAVVAHTTRLLHARAYMHHDGDATHGRARLFKNGGRVVFRHYLGLLQWVFLWHYVGKVRMRRGGTQAVPVASSQQAELPAEADDTGGRPSWFAWPRVGNLNDGPRGHRTSSCQERFLTRDRLRDS